MKKLWYYSLMLGLLMSSATFVACGDDDDDNAPATETPTAPENNPSFNIVGIWKVSHVGDNGLKIEETFVFKQDGTYERDEVEIEYSWVGAEKVPTRYETLIKGTYTYQDGTLKVKDSQCFGYDQEQKALVENTDYKPSDEYILPFVQCGNGILMMSRGINLYTREGVTPQVPSLAGSELVGRWEIRQPWIDNPDNVTIRYIEINADGTMVEGGENRHISTGEMFQGSRSMGILVLFDTDMVNKLLGSVSDMKIPAGAKFCSFIEDVADYYGMYEDSFKWFDKTPRFGGHPNQYVIKDGKLYFGVIGQDEEYFFSEDNALTKVK